MPHWCHVHLLCSTPWPPLLTGGLWQLYVCTEPLISPHCSSRGKWRFNTVHAFGHLKSNKHIEIFCKLYQGVFGFIYVVPNCFRLFRLLLQLCVPALIYTKHKTGFLHLPALHPPALYCSAPHSALCNTALQRHIEDNSAVHSIYSWQIF